MRKVALITGITGQDGSYLAEFLLAKEYEVHGIMRRSSSFNTARLDSIWHYQEPHDSDRKLFIHYGDLTDASSLASLIRRIEPTEIYNLGAQSHVRVSFDMPEYTSDVVALGTTRLLEAIRDAKIECKFYQASSSEMFGQSKPPQNEDTPFKPQSPYACSKLFSHWQTVNYRNGYNMFACSGILFNHETVSSCMPMIYKLGKQNIDIDIAPIADIVEKSGVKIDRTLLSYQSDRPDKDLYVWDKDGWTRVRYASAYPSELTSKNTVIINARNAVYSATTDHVVIMSDEKEKKIQNIQIGDRVFVGTYPRGGCECKLSRNEATLLGAIVGDGCISHGIKYTSSEVTIRDKIIKLWAKVGDGKWRYNPSKSGFTGKEVGQIVLTGTGKKWLEQFEIYTSERDVFGNRYKRVPKQILNASKKYQQSFLEGYNMADGLKKNPCKYLFKNFKTNSPTLASGLLFLISHVTGQEYNITVEESKKWGKSQYYYSVNLLSDSKYGQNHRNSERKAQKVLEIIGTTSQRGLCQETGISRGFIRKVQNGYIPNGIHHQSKPKNDVKKIIKIDSQGWFYDLETDSGTFHCGVGQGVVHNSPRRGKTFVTRKITVAISNILKGKQDKLYLGNLDARRDWGYAPEYVEAMWMMLQQDKPDDFVIATGETHTVKEFLEVAFSIVDLNWQDYVEIDEIYCRPNEVDILLGDSSKAFNILGWKPKITFRKLVEIMVEADLKQCHGNEKA